MSLHSGYLWPAWPKLVSPELYINMSSSLPFLFFLLTSNINEESLSEVHWPVFRGFTVLCPDFIILPYIALSSVIFTFPRELSSSFSTPRTLAFVSDSLHMVAFLEAFHYSCSQEKTFYRHEMKIKPYCLSSAHSNWQYAVLLDIIGRFISYHHHR